MRSQRKNRNRSGTSANFKTVNRIYEYTYREKEYDTCLRSERSITYIQEDMERLEWVEKRIKNYKLAGRRL
jgi:hypothetical protein